MGAREQKPTLSSWTSPDLNETLRDWTLPAGPVCRSSSGCAHEFRWKDLPLDPLYQPYFERDFACVVALGSELLIRMKRKFATEDRKRKGRFRLLPGSGDLRRNPFGELNMGLVEIDHTDLRYLLFGHRGGEPLRVFRSHPILCDFPRVR